MMAQNSLVNVGICLKSTELIFYQIVFCQLTVYDRCKRAPSILLSKEECFVWVDYSWGVMVAIVWDHRYIVLLP